MQIRVEGKQKHIALILSFWFLTEKSKVGTNQANFTTHKAETELKDEDISDSQSSIVIVTLPNLTY